ncbi:MAG: sarcosine oxidase subunit gamma family protein [Acidimicrobiia bacterium]|nr:sarcosine oxidase subunit gamma family protein [Acidimicrobiia bacterium]
MAEFRSPIVGPRSREGDLVRLEDESGIALARRFDGEAAPGTARRHGGRIEWSVSPGEWTVAGDGPGDVDLTHVRAVLRVSGIQARRLLEYVCALDLSDDVFPDGAAARTLVAGVTTEIVRDDRGGDPSYLVIPSRSFAGYLWAALVDAGAEFRL